MVRIRITVRFRVKVRIRVVCMMNIIDDTATAISIKVVPK